MVKKNSLILFAAMALLVTGCSNGAKGTNQTKASSSAESSSSVEKSTVSSTSTKDSTKTSSTASSSEAATPVEQENTGQVSTEGQAQEVLKELSQAYPNDKLPTAIMTASEAPYLTAATTGAGDQNNFRILYYAEDGAVTVNDPQVNGFTPVASFEKKTYDSAAAAVQAVSPIEPSGVKVDLGYGITGYSDSGAGNTHLGWKEGNWRLTVHAASINGENPVDLAKQAVKYFESAALPAPEQVGQVSLEVSNGVYQQQKVVWQVGSVVYTVTHGENLQVLKMAVSTAG